MRYVLLMNYREPAEGEISEEAIAEAMEAFGAYGRALQEAGVLLSGDVLQPTAATTTVTRRDGGLRVQDGPFAETKEALAGIFVLDVADLDAAIGWAEKCPGRAVGRDRGSPDRDRARQRRVDALTTATIGAGLARHGPTAARGRRGLAARDSYGRLLALLSASTSDIAAAEDALADAFERALRTWPAQGTPASPDAWLLTVARNRLRDHWKSAQAQRTFPLDGRQDSLAHTDDLDVDALPDRRLELMLVCAHPAIDRAAHTPLMLSTVLGFTAEQIGRAFSVPASTMATRLVRAKKRIKAARIPFRIPGSGETSRRGWPRSLRRSTARMSSTGRRPGRRTGSCPSEALHLAEVLTRCAPADPEAHGLAALVQLSASRAPARAGRGRAFRPAARPGPVAVERAPDRPGA